MGCVDKNRAAEEYFYLDELVFSGKISMVH